MKMRMILLVMGILFSTWMLHADETVTVTATSSDISENLDLKTVATLFGQAKDLEQFEQLLNDPEIDLIVIWTRQDTHASLIIESLDAGKWVWCEKPMCETKEEEELIIAAEKRAEGRLAIGFNRRFAPAVQKCRQVMLDKLPKPWIVNYRLQENGGYKTDKTDKFYHRRAHIIYEGCHHLDLANYLFGTLPERVFMSGTDADENDICILEYADGSRFILTITTNAGSSMLEKESMEVFSQGGALAMRDFVELRIRGIKGEKDCIFQPENLPWGELVTKYGYDCWESLFSKLIEPDMSADSRLVPTVVAQSEKVSKIYCAPGNAGISKVAECVPIGPMEFDKLVAFAKEKEKAKAVPTRKEAQELVAYAAHLEKINKKRPVWGAFYRALKRAQPCRNAGNGSKRKRSCSFRLRQPLPCGC